MQHLDICFDKLDRGEWCDRMSNRYYYQKSSNTCRGFHYTGCGKSRNNFREYEQCKNQCVKIDVKSQKKNLSSFTFGNNTSIKSNLIY